MMEQDPTDKAAELNNHGYDLAEAGRWKEAIAYYQEALRLNPRHVNSLTNMGNALQALGHLSEALSYQDKALAADPNNALAWSNKAVILSGLNRRPEAIRCYDHAIELDPFNSVSWFNKGVALFLTGKKLEALECLDHILDNIDSRMKNALGAKAEILKADGRTNEAAKCLERMNEIDMEGEPFSFASVQVNMNLFGSEVDTRKMLRGFEVQLRNRTGLPQITADFMPSGRTLEPTRVEYSQSRGYRVWLSPFLVGEISKGEAEIVEFIQNHARKLSIRPAPPPIPATETNYSSRLIRAGICKQMTPNLMPEFALRFPKAELSEWAKLYSYADDDRVLEIGERTRKAGYYTRDDFLDVCEWKTRGRPRRHYQRNSEDDVRRVTALALSSADEPTRLWTLVAPKS